MTENKKYRLKTHRADGEPTVNEKIGQTLKNTNDSIGNALFGANKKIEKGVVGSYKKIETAFTNKFLEEVDDDPKQKTDDQSK